MVEHETDRSEKKTQQKLVQKELNRGSTEEEGKSTNIWGNGTAEEPFA
jgi:hypothetical protein